MDNHEANGFDTDALTNALRDVGKATRGRVIFLKNSCVQFGNAQVFGATIWAIMSPSAAKTSSAERPE